ncbi:MAG: glycosyltransferase family 4 protein [Oscillatoria sp. PMC 1068.18]|nr:glycosyltransferase family 4 protein [Oscillatoria sp. PMC 1076.18]MEC4989698.1 glycosyltransferase family 4 protein [Oscillatoria sp. PMC 1068.18]
MKILISSPLFYPSIGGLETVVSLLASEFVQQKHQVKLATETSARGTKNFTFEVIRKPNPQLLLSLTQWCDVYFQPNISLKQIWPLLIIRKPWVVAHHNWYTRSNGNLSWQDYLKHFSLKFASGISVSKAVANHLSTPSTVIPNPYQKDIFVEIPEIPRDKELVFLGRLVSDKGVDLLLQALANLKQIGLTPKLTIIGSGPEESNLHQQTQQLQINELVDFVGVKIDQELTKLLNAHQIMVIPSRWQEPFGVVALEGIACGCVIVGSEGGGLKEAIGNCGVTFPNGDIKSLTQVLFNLLSNPEQLNLYRQNSQKHLINYQPVVIAKAYLQVMQQAAFGNYPK